MALELTDALRWITVHLLDDELADRDIGLQISDLVLDRLGEAGFDPVYGARPLKRAIQQQIENPLAQKILSGDYLPSSTVKVGVGEEGITFE